MTNFALMMRVMNLSPQQVASDLRTDTTLVSRWRTGNRLITQGRHWAGIITDYLLAEDAKSERPVFPRLLHRLWPDLNMSDPAVLRVTAEAFLTEPDQMDPTYRQRVVSIVNEMMAGEIEPMQVYMPLHAGSARNAVGASAVRKMMLEFIEAALKLSKTHEVLFFCPQGLALLTADPKSAARLTSVVSKAFRSGCRLRVVMPTRYRAPDVALFSGLWMAAHLKGYVESFHYDTFPRDDKENMIAVVRGELALSVTYGKGSAGMASSLYTDGNAIESLYRRALVYAGDDAVRLHRGFLRQPGGYLVSSLDYMDAPCYMMTEMPQFGYLAMDEYQQAFQMDEQTVESIWTEYAPLVQPVAEMPRETCVRHLFCSTAIDEALLEGRCVVPALSEMNGRRTHMTAQNLVLTLKRMKALLKERKNYDVCFVPKGAYADLKVQTVAWGSECAVCWIAGKGSAATHTHLIAGALYKYCESKWVKIPPQVRSRAAAIKQIDQWLRKAMFYGLEV